MFVVMQVAAFALAAASMFAPQSVRVGLDLDERGRFTIGVSTFGDARIALDAAKLRLYARAYGSNVLRDVRPLPARIGEATPRTARTMTPAYTTPGQPAGSYEFQTFEVPLDGIEPPGPPGAYELWAEAAPGFATTSAGASIPLAERTDFTKGAPSLAYWPDETQHDRALERMRERYVGHDVYGYGGIAISCRPDVTTAYDAATPIRVRAIERERGHVERRGIGAGASGPYVRGAAFFAFDPLLFVVDRPPERYVPLGTNRGIGGTATACPSIELADYQVDTVLSLTPPPLRSEAFGHVRVGQTRAEVAWALGFPNDFGTRADVFGRPAWHYGVGVGAFTITFARDRVAAYTTGAIL